jgi:hypothetical protein
MKIGQLRKLQSEIHRRIGKEVTPDILAVASRSMGIKINPMKILNKTPIEENKRGKKP